MFTNIAQNPLNATAPILNLAGLQNHLNSIPTANTQQPPPQHSHDPFASISNTDLTGTLQDAPAHSHAATTQHNRTFPDQPGMVCAIPAPSDRITPSRILDLSPSSGKPKWHAFSFSRHDTQPTITKGTDWNLNTSGQANAGYAQSFTSYAAVLNYILTIFYAVPPASHLCPNCMLRHLEQYEVRGPSGELRVSIA